MKSWNRGQMKKVLCRLMGDRAGGVMMEYVILAVLVAAAAVVAVMFFGRGIVTSLSTSTHAIAGESKAASSSAKKGKSDAVTAETANETYRREHADQ